MGYLQVLLACYHHLAAAPLCLPLPHHSTPLVPHRCTAVAASRRGVGVQLGVSHLYSSPSSAPFRASAFAPPSASPTDSAWPARISAQPRARVGKRDRGRSRNSASRRVGDANGQGWESSRWVTGVSIPEGQQIMEPLNYKIRQRQPPHSRGIAIHSGKYAVARRWCHSRSTLSSRGTLPRSAQGRSSLPSDGVLLESGDSKERPSLLDELLRRLQQRPCVPASDGCVDKNCHNLLTESGAEVTAAMTVAALPTPPVSGAPVQPLSGEESPITVGASREHACLGKGAAIEEDVYVPLLFRAEFRRANPHALRHTPNPITKADAAVMTPSKTVGTCIGVPSDSTAQATCDTLRVHPLREELGQVVREAVPVGARALAPVENAVFINPATTCAEVTASPGRECDDDVALEEFNIDDITTAHCSDELEEDEQQQLGGDASAKVQTAAPCGAEQEGNDVEDAIFDETPHTADGDVLQKCDRRTRHLILDPVEWLAQASDAPLMDEGLLGSKANIKDHLGGLITSPAGDAYTETPDQHTGKTTVRDADVAINEASPSAAGVAATLEKGFDQDTALFMASASKRGIDDDEGEGESTRLQEALIEDLYADVPRSIRKQQWRPPIKKRTKRNKAFAATTTTGESTSGEHPADGVSLLETHLGSVVEAKKLQNASVAPVTTHIVPLASENVAEKMDSISSSQRPPEVDAPSLRKRKGDEAASPGTQSEALVYNVFTHRVAKVGSISIRSLALMGIGVNQTTRELCVADGEALRSFAVELRASRLSWPKLWSRGPLYQKIERLLSDTAVEDPVKRVDEVLKMQYSRSHLLRQKPGFVVGGDAAESTQTPSSVAPAEHGNMIESIHEKLLTMQDLNAEQQAVVQLVMQGHHTYIGGGAGTGKSVLLRVIKQQLAREGLVVAVTGTTGVAGTQIGGCTLHHCLGINALGEFTRRKELSSFDVIIIDEVSMLSRELLESLEVHLRRANNVDLPFGGVQMILSGDFLQLGAINAQPIITSSVFRRNFVQLKLHTVVRQDKNLRFAAQLQQLRRGKVPLDLHQTVHLTSREQVVTEHQAAIELRARQQAQLQRVLSIDANKPAADIHANTLTNTTRSSDAPSPQSTPATAMESSALTAHCLPDVAAFVEGAVNLLPTNREVDATNAQQLERLEGELITYTPQLLPPSLVGSWSPTYVLRIVEPKKLNIKTFALEIQRHLAAFYTHGQRASSRQMSRSPVRLGSCRKGAVSFSNSTATLSNFSDGSWLLHPGLSERSIVLYPLFVDALALRVRLPMTMDKDEAKHFLLYLSEIDDHLQRIDSGVRVRDVLLHADGMHTEKDEFILMQYAQHTPMFKPLQLKIGARVMLRTNLAPGLVNGSLGTVVGFRKLEVDQLPRYIVGNEQREQSILQYAEFLQYEHGFEAPLVPVLDFNGRQEVIPPVTLFVGGGPNTHFYSLGIVALPLSLAYAFTVHKVQGLTLVGRVHLELSRMWPCEHLLYVAMSRVRNPEQLTVSSFHPRLVRAAADCLLFDDSLPPVTEATIAPYMVPATWRRCKDRRKKTQLRNRLEEYAKRRQRTLQSAARRGDILSEIRLLEEKMLKQRARASAAPSKAHTPSLQ